MATYKVKTSQNIFDVALDCYGSIEGLFDLLITNDWLTMTTDLQPGMELEYHDFFVVEDSIKKAIQDNNYLCANSERHVYYKHTDKPCRFISKIPVELHSVSFRASGEGVMYIDWGDNTPLEEVELTVAERLIQHYFDNHVDARTIVVYGEFTLMTFNTSEMGGSILPVCPLVVDEFTNRANGHSLNGLFLFEGTVKVDLTEMQISDLSPIGDMSLQELNLTNVRFSTPEVLDNYLSYIVRNYGQRRNCTVYLTQEPGQLGMDAIKVILGEAAWNEAGPWKFVINGKIYTRS